ncbi:lactoylglutathione lyase [Metarhizobium album]|uniref:Lactoylglutathione lyase n=1 Tax=Metarhizobium album TaxID=2182425 RepID=A0A2U2DPV2_9HYPH|nr:VOC family protein [Rhizobium album]PWE55346.1 lactoylglutathione lyase [Rhizobium album]
MSASASGPRAVDHLVLPTAGLDLARQRLTELGFTVASDARHPFGTENACVYLADKTYLEPLAVADAGECAAAAKAGNMFVARDQAFRFRRGAEGFSGIALASNDAEEDDRAFREAGLSGGPMLTFSRPVKMPDGASLTASFLLAFAADLRSPDFTFFTCERKNPLPADRSALEAHRNGASGLSELLFSEPGPADFRDFLTSIVSGKPVDGGEGALSVEAANVRLTVLDPEAMEECLGLRTSTHSRGLRGQAVVFRTRDLDAAHRVLSASAVAFTARHNRLIVPPAPGQGAVFVFEDMS